MKITKAEKQYIREALSLDPKDLTKKGIEAIRGSYGYAYWIVNLAIKEFQNNMMKLFRERYK